MNAFINQTESKPWKEVSHYFDKTAVQKSLSYGKSTPLTHDRSAQTIQALQTNLIKPTPTGIFPGILSRLEIGTELFIESTLAISIDHSASELANKLAAEIHQPRRLYQELHSDSRPISHNSIMAHGRFIEVPGFQARALEALGISREADDFDLITNRLIELRGDGYHVVGFQTLIEAKLFGCVVPAILSQLAHQRLSTKCYLIGGEVLYRGTRRGHQWNLIENEGEIIIWDLAGNCHDSVQDLVRVKPEEWKIVPAPSSNAAFEYYIPFRQKT